MLLSISRGNNSNLFKLFSRTEREETYPDLIYEASVMWMLKVDKDSMRKTNYRIFSLMKKDSKILSKLLAKQIQQYVRRMFHYNVVLIPGM